MIYSLLRFASIVKNNFYRFSQKLAKLSALTLVLINLGLVCLPANQAIAGIDDDRYEGNIYILYAGNGSLVPPRINLKESLARETPAIVVFCVDDSSDCKQYSTLVSRFQEFYGRAASIIPVNVDALDLSAKYQKDQEGYYYKGKVPQTVIIDQKGKVVFNEQGQPAYEKVDDQLRKVFDLLPREESVQLQRRSFNEYNSEITN